MVCSNLVYAESMVFDTDIRIQEGNMVFLGSGRDDSAMKQLIVGSNYLQVDNILISVTGLTQDMFFNVTHVNEIGNNRSVGERLLEMNITYGGGATTFTFTGNSSNDNMLYDLLVDGTIVRNNVGPFTFTYTRSSWSTHRFLLRCSGYEPDPPYNGSSTYTQGTPPYVNLSWERGNYSNQEVVVGNADSYPSSPSDGTVWYNGTNLYYNFSVNETQYFTVWSYNVTTNTFSSTGLDIPWGVLRLNVFNQSKTWQKVNPFGLTIQNQDGNTIYQQSTCSPPFYLDLNDIPIGVNTVFIINATHYEQQRYEEDTLVNHFHNFTFLLPPVITSDPGGGDDDPVTGDPTNHTESLLYLISVVDELGNPISDVKVEFNLYVNATDTYENAGSFTTDGNGQGTIYLVPESLYQVVVSKDEYKTGTSYWTPSRELLSKTFLIEFEDSEPVEPDTPIEDISFTFERGGNTVFINYTDGMSETIDTMVYIWEIDSITGVETLLTSDSRIGESSFSFAVTDVNTSNTQKAILYYNHSTFGYQTITLVLHGDYVRSNAGTSFNVLLVALVGSHPWGWANFLIFMFLLAVFHEADDRDAGKWLVLIGGLFLFLNIVVGWNSTLFTVAGGAIPVLFIAVGVLQMWKDSRRKTT